MCNQSQSQSQSSAIYIPAQVKLAFACIKGYRHSWVQRLDVELRSSMYRDLSAFLYLPEIRNNFPTLYDMVADQRVTYLEAQGRFLLSPRLLSFCAGCGALQWGTSTPGGQLTLECGGCYVARPLVATRHPYLELIQDVTGYPYELLAYWLVAHHNELYAKQYGVLKEVFK